MDITLGLDIGTHQTKVALCYTPNNETIFEFIEFRDASGTARCLLPSVVQLNDNDTLSYGNCDDSTVKRTHKSRPHKSSYPPKPEIQNLVKPKRETIPPPPPKYIKVKISKKRYRKDVSPEYRTWLKHFKAIDYAYRKELMEWEKNVNYNQKLLNDWKEVCTNIDDLFNEQMDDYKRNPHFLHTYRYFKLGCFSDEPYTYALKQITDEKLMVWYMVYVLLFIKQYIKDRFSENFEESVSVQMGVPSGFNTEISKSMEEKAKMLLVTARMLMENFDSVDHFLSIKLNELDEMTKFYEEEDLDMKAYSYGFIIKPEAYAGLQSLSSTSRLKHGMMHLLVDIGGGTTDVGFFTVRKDKTPDVHIVESFHMGLNYVFEAYLEDHPDVSIQDVQDDFQKHPQNYMAYSKLYTQELRKHLAKMVYEIVNEFVKGYNQHKVSINNLFEAMMSRPIVYCGGGSTYPSMRIPNQYFSDIYVINKDVLNIPNLVNEDIDDSLFTILATAYGLSIPDEEGIHMKDLSELFRQFCMNVELSDDVDDIKDYGLQDHI